MREVDLLTTEKLGTPSLLLMENAAHAVARAVTKKLGGSVKKKSIIILSGKGNNGGDGGALARILWTQGADINFFLFGKIEETRGDARINFEIIKKISDSYDYALDGNLLIIKEDCALEDIDSSRIYHDAIVDAIFGTGLTRPLEGVVKAVIKHLKKNKDKLSYAEYISVDVPSGLNSDLVTKIGESFPADLTVTFTAPKPANLLLSNGELVVANIGSIQELIQNSPSKVYLTEKADVLKWLESTRVTDDSYKKNRGTALIISGSENYAGAAVLVSNACFVSGAGMVTVAVPKSVKTIVTRKTADEIIVKTLENIDVLAEKVDVIAIGCGLGNDSATHKTICETVENRKTPMVLDAEALNALSPFNIEGSDELPLVLTPHLGEFERLLGREVGDDRIAEVREFAQKYNVILVLKGERSLIAKPDGTVIINPTGNAGVSRAGAGDTLAGIITGFLAQTSAVKVANIENTFEAVAAALYLAGLAGDIGAEKFSQRLLTATDVRQCLQEAIEKLNADQDS